MKIFGAIVGMLVSINIIFQAISWYAFKNAGARFTAADGQELCLRIKRLEEVSYGFRDNHYSPLSCHYIQTTP